MDLWIPLSFHALACLIAVTIVDSEATTDLQSEVPKNFSLNYEEKVAQIYLFWEESLVITQMAIYELTYTIGGNSGSYEIQNAPLEFVLDKPPCTIIGLNLRVRNTTNYSDEFAMVAFETQPETPSEPTMPTVVNDPSLSGQQLTWLPPVNYSQSCSLQYEVIFRTENDTWESAVVEDTQYQAKLLNWDTKYFYRVRALAGKQKIAGQFSEEVSLSTEEIPSTNALSLTLEATTNSILAKWSLPPNQTFSIAYRLSYLINETEVAAKITDLQTWYLIEPLKSCTVYTVSLSAYNVATVSLPITKTIQTEPLARPQAPQIIHHDTSCGTIFIRWIQAEPEAAVIVFRIKVISLDGTEENSHITGENELLIRNLVCDQSYHVSVYARNACGLSLPSETKVIIARSEAPPNKPEDFEVDPDPTSISLRWKDAQPTKLDLSYKVTLTELNTTEWDTFYTERVTKTPQIRVTRLPPCTEFILRVVATNPFGTVASDDIFVRTTAPVPEVPSNIEVTYVNATSHIVSWDPIPLETKRCKLSYQIEANNVYDGVADVFNTSETSFIVSNLELNRTYTYTVAALLGTPIAISEASGAVVLNTPPGPVSALQSFWSYVIIVISLCVVTVAILLCLIFGRGSRNIKRLRIKSDHMETDNLSDDGPLVDVVLKCRNIDENRFSRLDGQK
ncbi:protein tyrosine phosphatase receptor type F [Clonorchis sinensis]|uniref:Protein tyrosine phosphatase receptor type F n=1 Tax=Clonorchis sinensis TaxID=79923 RepID=G7YDW8_CLOSI|nr:protein tyrosine phosphatase receptor type F [Clonorchis sinensis]